MSDDNGDVSEFIEPGAHPPVVQRKKKLTLRQKAKQTRSGPNLQDVFNQPGQGESIQPPVTGVEESPPAPDATPPAIEPERAPTTPPTVPETVSSEVGESPTPTAPSTPPTAPETVPSEVGESTTPTAPSTPPTAPETVPSEVGESKTPTAPPPQAPETELESAVGEPEQPATPEREPSPPPQKKAPLSPADTPGSAADDVEPPILSYSNEARAYHARFAELSNDHENGFYYRCKEGCLDMLSEPNLPLFTRVQTLQMLSTMLEAAGAERILHTAREVLDSMDQGMVQVELLQSDNRRMLDDLLVIREKHGIAENADFEMLLAEEIKNELGAPQDLKPEVPYPGGYPDEQKEQEKAAPEK